LVSRFILKYPLINDEPMPLKRPFKGEDIGMAMARLLNCAHESMLNDEKIMPPPNSTETALRK
jgi:hypothetical protein